VALQLAGKRVTVIGLARSGVAACKLLAAHGAEVRGSDARPAEALAADLADLRQRGVVLETGGHTPASFRDADLVVISPGVPTGLPLLASARERGIPVWGEVELASRLTEARFLAVTGTNGKSTTTCLVGAMLQAAGIPSVVAGNIGTALSEVVPALTRDHWVVAELSSFQLETIVSFRPRIALLLNLAPDHLDRYADAEDYYRAKARIFENQGPEDAAVLNAEDPLVPVYARDLRARPLFFSRTRAVEEGACLREGQIVLRRAGQAAAVCPAGAVRILGLHNLENGLAAAAAAAAAGAPPAAIGAALREFPGLPHRLEPVGERNGVRFINDSKGTNVGAVQKSLESFARGVILIAGGKDKGGDFAPLRPLLESRVKRLLLLGEAAGTIREQLRGACPMETVATLEEAVRRGAALAEAGDTVLLSPACASFDMFRDFEQRGDVFRRAVQELLGRRGGERANG